MQKKSSYPTHVHSGREQRGPTQNGRGVYFYFERQNKTRAAGIRCAGSWIRLPLST